jgi:hypothetical protein
VADVDIGTLAGKVALEDKTTATVDLILSKVTALESKFSEGLNPSVVKAAEGFAIAEGAIRLFDKAVETAVDVVKDLTLEGAKIGDIEDNFEHLTSSAGRLGSTLLGELRAGTHNTINDLELIKIANNDLAAGVDLTDKQFRTMANGAFALAQAKGIDVKQALDDVNDAVLKGTARGVQYLTGRIDIASAEDAFAASLGTTADRLNEEGKAQAGRIAILDAVSKATGRLGDQTDGLDEVIAQIGTKWDNFYEQLAKAIGTSPAVVRAFETVGDSLTKAFGGDSQHMVETVAGWVNTLADKVTQYAPVVVDGFIKIKTWIADTIAEVRAGWDTLPDWLKATAADSLIAGAAFMTMNAGVKAVSGGSFDLVGTLGNLTTTLSGLPTALGNVKEGLTTTVNLFKIMDFSSLAQGRASINLLGSSITGLIGPLGAVGLATAAVFAAYEIGKTKPVSDFFERAGLMMQGFSKAEAEAAIASRHQFEEQQKAAAASKAQADAIAQAKAMMDAFTKSTHDSSAATDHNTDVQDKNKFLVNQTREELKKMSDARKALASVDEDWHKTVDALDQTMVKSIMHYLEAGVAQDKLATFYKLTAEQVAAVAKALTDQTAAEKIAEKAASDAEKRWSDLAGLRASMSGKATDIMVADEQRWVAAEIKAHVDAKTDTADFYNWLGQMDRTRTEAAVQARLKDNNNSKTYWDDQKAQAQDAYQFALEHADQFTDGYIRGLKETKEIATDAAANWKQHVGQTLDDLTHKAEALDQALKVAFSFDVNAQNLQQTLNGMHPGNDPNKGNFGGRYQQAVELAKKGFSFQEIMNFFNGAILPDVPIGPRIPGFRDGGVGDFGAGTIVELHGKEAIVPLDGHSGGVGGAIYNTFHVNGTAHDVARQIGDVLMNQLKARRYLPTAG